MTRVKVSAAVFMLLVILSIITGTFVSRKCDRLSEDIDAAMEAASDGDEAALCSLAARINDDWESFRKYAALFIRGDRLAEADKLLCRVNGVIKEKSSGLYTELSEFSRVISLMKNREIPTLVNLM